MSDTEPVTQEPVGISRRGLLLTSGAVAATSLAGFEIPRAKAASSAVPTWDAVNGFSLGSRKASVSEMTDYVAAVTKASARVRTEVIGRTGEGRELRIMIVSHPDNMDRLDSIERSWRALRDRPTTAAAGVHAALSLPAFVLMLPNVHGNEPAGSDSMMQVLYDLASGQDAATLQRLRQLVVVMMISQNPDGRVGNHRTSARGFDLNRDWFAMTQEETPAKVALYRRFPCLLGMDLHEQFLQGSDSFYFPPNADPVHAECSHSGVISSNDFISPTIAKAFDAKGYTYTHYGIYDLFAPIYGDSVPNLAFGASGFIVEMENENSYRDKFDRTYTSAHHAVEAVFVHRAALATAWAKQWVENRDRGASGILAPNFVQQPGAAPALPVPRERVYGYAIRARRRKADVALLAHRLLQYGVQLHLTRRAVRVARLRPFGGDGFSPATLEAGTVLVTAAQPMKHWVHIILADDPHASVNYFYDVSGWSNPLMMALEGGAIGSDIASVIADPSAVSPLMSSTELAGAAPKPAGSFVEFALDTSAAQAAAFALLAQGVEVLRTDAGMAVVPSRDLAAVTSQTQPRGIPLAVVPSGAFGASTLRRPKVALVHDIVSDAAEILFARSSGFAQWLLEVKLGLDVTLIYANQIDLGTLTLGGYDALVVPAGFATVLPAGAPNADLSLPAAGLTPAGLLEINLFVRNGGTYLGWCSQGITTAQAAGIAGNLRSSTPLSGLLVPGSPFAVQIHDGHPATAGLAGFATAFNVRDPILHGGGTTIVSYPAVPRSFGYSEGASALANSVAATALDVGLGRSYVFAFDPTYRAWAEATQAIVGNALLTPPSGTAAGSSSITPALLGRQHAGRECVVRVETTARTILEDVLRTVTGVPRAAAVTRGTHGVELRAPLTDPLGAHTEGWVRRLLQALDERGVRPSLVIA